MELGGQEWGDHLALPGTLRDQLPSSAKSLRKRVQART
jgi:hypothetical protein